MPSLPPITRDWSPTPGRVLHVVGETAPWAQTGGTVRTGEILRWQRAAGIDTRLVTAPGFPWARGVGRAPDTETVEGTPHYRLAPGVRDWRPDGGPGRGEALAAPPGPPEPRDALYGGLLRRLAETLRPQALHGTTGVQALTSTVAVARALGLPVIASDLPSLRELVIDGVNGLIVPPGDAARLAEAARPLLVNPARRREVGAAARAWVLAHRSWRANRLRYLELYRELGLDMGPVRG